MAGEEIGSLVVRIEANLKNFEDNVSKMNDKISGFGNTVKKIGGVIAGAFVVDKVTDFFKSTIEDAAEAQDGLSQLNAVIASTGGKAGVTADQVTEMAAALQKSTKFSDDAIIAGDNLLLTFTSIGKDVFPQATETMLNMSQALGQDVKSSAIQLGKALNDPINGVTALKRVGVSFTESQMQQIKALQESGDIMGAQKLILAELNTEFGNAAKAAGETFSGKLERLKNQFGEIKESIGGALLPVLSNMSEWFISKMPDIQNFVVTAFDNIKNVIQPIYETVIPLLQQGFQFFSDNIIPLFSGRILETSNTILPIIIDAFNYIVNNVLPPLIKIFQYIATEIVPMLAKKFQEWIPTIVNIMKGLWDAIKIVLDLIIQAFNTSWPTIKDVVTVSVNMITGVIGGLLQILNGLIDFIVGVFTGNWERAWNGVKEIFSGIWDSIGSVLKGGLNYIIAGINTFIHGLNQLKIPDWVPEFGGMGINIPNIPYLAKGTNNFAGGLAIVGEKGPELVNLPGGSDVIPNDKTQQMLGQTINYDGMFKGAIFNVRSDADIKSLAREIYNLQQQRSRASGVIAAT